MGHTVVLAPAALRSLRHLVIIAVAALTAMTIQVAAQAASAPAPAPVNEPALVQVSSTTLLPGQTVQSYHMTVTNLGADTDVELNAPVPAASVIEASTDTGRYDAGTWTVGTLEAGATASLDLSARN